MEITVRTATLDDLPMLYEFEQGVISAERPFDPTIKSIAIHYYDFNEMIATPHIKLVVAQTSNEVIGSGYARIEKAKLYLKHQKYAYFGFMFVKPEYRGQGVNKMVIQNLQDWCKQHQVTECRLEVYTENNAAIKAYQKLGFEKLLITMRTAI